MRFKKNKNKNNINVVNKAGGVGGACTLLTEERIHVLCRTKKQKNYQQTAVLMLPTPPHTCTRTPQLQYCIVLGTLA